MSASPSKSRSPVERSYSSASSTTSSRRSGRRRRQRMKHTVMPLKKRTGRQEVPCDVHRVSNLDHEDMEQSACFWITKNADDQSERSFKEEVFVNKDQDSMDEDSSYLEESQSRTTDEITHELRTDSSFDAKYVNKEEKIDAYYAKENDKNDANFSEEKTFYGVRKGKVSDGNGLERVSPLPSPRNRSRMSSLSDEGGFSSEGTGMHVGWTSDVVSSEPEYSAMTDEDSGGEGGNKRTDGNSKEFYGYRRRDGEKRQSEFPTRKIRERNNNQSSVVIATDVTATESTEVQNFEERRNGFEREHQENVEIDQRSYTKEESKSSSYSPYDFDSRVSDPPMYETSEHGAEVLLPGREPTRHQYPSSDTELVNFRSFDIDIETYSDRSLPLGGHKTKTQYYSVEDLIKSAKEEAEVQSVEKADSGSDGPEVPRGYGEYDNYEPPREDDHSSRGSHADDQPIRGPHADDHATRGPHAEPQTNGIDNERPRVVPSSYEVTAQRPLLVPRREKKFDEHGEEDLSPREGKPEVDDYSGTYEDSKEFHGYRRAKPGNEYESENKENFSPHYNNEKYSGRPTNRDNFESTGTSKEFDDQREFPGEDQVQPDDDRKFEENQEFYGYRHPKTGAEPRDDVDRRQRYEGKKASGDDQHDNTKWEGTKEFYGYRTSKTGAHFDSNEQPRYEHEKESGQPPNEKAWEQNQEFYGYRESRTGNKFDNVNPQDEKQQTSSNTTKTRTFAESREFYGFKSKVSGSLENISKDSPGGKDSQTWEESKEFFGFRRRQVVNGQSYSAVSGHQERPNDGKPRYLESADDIKRRDEGLKQATDASRPVERVTKSTEQENLMSVDDRRDFDNRFEESEELYGYRRGQGVDERLREARDDNTKQDDFDNNFEESKEFQEYPPEVPRSIAYELYQKPGQEPRSENVPTPGKRQTSEPEIKDSRMDDMYARPNYTHGDNDLTREYYPTGDYDSNGVPRDRHMFNIFEVPSSKKVIPLVSDVAPKIETTTTETTTKRLHTRSERDTLRREARHPEPTVPESSDVGMKMFRQRSLPRKHGHTTSSDEKNKELPRKMKKSDEPDLSQCDPDFANKFREIQDKRKKKVKTKTTIKTTETTTESAVESCNKNVEDLVNVFNTLEKTTDKTKSDKNAPPKAVKCETLDTPTGEDGKLSPATSISQKLHEIENILDSVDKNRQRRTFSDHSETRNTTTTHTTRETRKTREERETREKHAWKPDNDEITKQEALSVQSYLPEEPSRRRPAGRGKTSDIPDRNRPWSYTDRPMPYRPARQPRGYDKTRSRDDDDETYCAQIKKGREEKWRDGRASRKKYDSKSDGEIEGFKSTPFGDRVITPGTPVNIRLYGLNLQKTNEDRSNDLNWELFTKTEVPVDESVGRTQLMRQPLEAGQIPGTDEPRMEEPAIDRSHVRPTFGVNCPPSFGEQTDEPPIMREQHETLYRRQERLPRRRDAPIARSDELDDDKITTQDIQWSHPPVSKARPKKEPPEKELREKEPPSKVPRAESPNTKEVMEVDSFTETNTETTRKDTRIKSIRKDTSEYPKSSTSQPDKRALSEEWPSEKQPQDELPFEVYPSEEKPLEDLPFESSHTKKRPSEKRPQRKRPSERRPSEESPSEERPEDIEIPIEKDQETETNEEPDERVIEIEYTDDFPDEDKNTLPEQSTLPDNVLRSSTPKDKPRSPRLSDDIFDQDSHEMTHEESSSSDRHESTTKNMDHTIHTTRTTRTTHSETTETTVKTVRKSGSESSRPESSTPATGEPDLILPVRNKPEYATPERSRPEDGESEPEYFTPAETAPEWCTPGSDEPQPDTADGEPRRSDEPSLVAHEYIVMNKNDTGRPVNLTLLGRVIETDEEDLSSQSREDLFLHTRLKMVTEKKKMRTGRLPENAHLLEPNPADQDDVGNEGELTDSDDEYNPDVTDQLLIPISGKIKENIKKDKQDKPSYMFPKDDTTDIFTPQTQVDESVSKTDHPTRESITRDSLGDVFVPRIFHETDLEKENAPTKNIPDFQSIPGFEQPISENVDFSRKPEKPGLEFGEPFGDEEPHQGTVKDIEVVVLPLFDDFIAESAPNDVIVPTEKTPVYEKVSKERTAIPTLPELEHEPVDENIISEKHDTDLNIPDIPESKQVSPVDEIINPSTLAPKDVYIPDLEEALPEIRRPPTPELVDETITSEEREIEVNLPHFSEARPLQPIDEDTILSERIEKQFYVPDLQEFFPETKKPVIPVDENVTFEKREAKLDIPEFQVAEPERRASEPITEQISAEEPITSDVYIPDFAEISMEFQEVVPEFPDSNVINEDREDPWDDETRNVELPYFQEAVQEPVRNLSITESDLVVEAPTSSSSQNLSSASELSFDNDKIDGDPIDDAAPEDEDLNKTPEKDTPEKEVPEKGTPERYSPEKDFPEKNSPEEESWSETHKTVRETRTTETVTVEKTVTKYAPEKPQEKDERAVSPKSPKAVHFVSSIEPKDSSGSSSEPSPRSSSGASADVSDRSTDVTPEVLDTDKPKAGAQKRRSRRGNRFDNIKRAGPLVPESVVRDESPGSDVPRVGYPGVMFPRDSEPILPEREQPVSNVPDSGTLFFTPRPKSGELRPEMFLLDSDDENQEGSLSKPDEEVVVTELCVPEERENAEELSEEIPEENVVPGEDDVPGENECPPRDELSPELIDELLEKEVLGLAEDDESPYTSDEEPVVLEEITKENKEPPELEHMPEQVPIDEELDETVLPEKKFDHYDNPEEVTEDIEKSLISENKPQLSDEDDDNLSGEEIELAVEQERNIDNEPWELVEKVSIDELTPKDTVVPEIARTEPLEALQPDEEPENSGAEETAVPDTFEVILIEHLNKDDDVSDKDDDDVMDKDDDVSDKNDDDVMERDFPGGVTTEESTVETVIVEKTHSEVSTTVTEVTTTRYPNYPLSPQDVPPTTTRTPEDHKVAPSDDEDEFVKIPIDVAKDELVEPSEVETVEGTPDDEPTDDQQPIPTLIVTKEPVDQRPSYSESDKESSSSESSTTESDDEGTDSGIDKVVSTEAMAEATNPVTETIFGIVDIEYEKPQRKEIFMLEKTVDVEIQEIPKISKKTLSGDDSEKDVLVVVLPEDVPTHDNVPMMADQAPEKDRATLELDIVVVSVSDESSSSSDDEPTSKNKRVPRGTSDTTVETIIVEKTSTQISTTITKITASSDESDDSEKDVPVTIVPEDAPTSESVPEDTTTHDDVPISEAFPSTPEEWENPQQDTDIVVVLADMESTTSSESTTDDEEEPREIPETTIETIVVEKTHSQVSTSITEITANAPNYPIGSETPTSDDAKMPVEEVPISEDILKSEYLPTHAEYPMADDSPTTEDIPKTEESSIYETAPILEESDRFDFEISPADDIDGLGPKDRYVTKIITSESESQTENRDVYSDATQTDDTTEIRGTTRDAYSMTPTRLSSDSEIQTQIPQGSASTQTDMDADSQHYRYIRTVEEVRESSEKVTTMTRQCSDNETQTDIPVDDSETQTHVIPEFSEPRATSQEGTQTDESREGGYSSETEVTRITRTTETRSESTYEEKTNTTTPRDDIETDCPVCFQSLEATNYSFIKVRDISRFTAMEDRSTQYELQEESHSFCFSCGRGGSTTRELSEGSGYSNTTRDKRGHEVIMMDNRDEREREGLMMDNRETSRYSSTTRDERGQEEYTRDYQETSGYSSTTREEWKNETSTRETSGYSSTTREEWGEDVVIQSESSTDAPGEAHFTIRIDGDEKCSLYCRRPGKHACALQKLASIIQAQKRATTSSNTASAQAHSSETVEKVESESEDCSEHMETGPRDVIGQGRCDVSIQTDGALLPADFEVFSDKDFEIYYDEQKSPWFV